MQDHFCVPWDVYVMGNSVPLFSLCAISTLLHTPHNMICVCMHVCIHAHSYVYVNTLSVLHGQLMDPKVDAGNVSKADERRAWCETVDPEEVEERFSSPEHMLCFMDRQLMEEVCVPS